MIDPRGSLSILADESKCDPAGMKATGAANHDIIAPDPYCEIDAGPVANLADSLRSPGAYNATAKVE